MFSITDEASSNILSFNTPSPIIVNLQSENFFNIFLNAFITTSIFLSYVNEPIVIIE